MIHSGRKRRPNSLGSCSLFLSFFLFSVVLHPLSAHQLPGLGGYKVSLCGLIPLFFTLLTCLSLALMRADSAVAGLGIGLLKEYHLWRTDQNSVTQDGTMGKGHPTQRRTQGAGIVRGWEDKRNRGRIPDTFQFLS